MPKTEDGGFILDDSGLCPYSIDDGSEKEDKKRKRNYCKNCGYKLTMTKEQARKILDIFLSEDEDEAEVISIKYLYTRDGDHYFEVETKVTEENRILPNGVENDGLSILMVCEDGNVLGLPT